jgi:hypothetical protein
MRTTTKALTLTILLVFAIVPLTQMPQGQCDTSNLKDKTYSYIQNVLPYDMNQYTINFQSQYSLPAPAGAPVTDSIVYDLKSSSSTIHVVFVCENSAIQQVGIDFTAGTPISDRNYSSLAEAAARVLDKHQEYIGADSTQLINMLGLVNESSYMNVTVGNVNLRVSHMPALTGLTMVNGTPVPVTSDSIVNTDFEWTISYGDVVFNHVVVYFENGVFSGLQDDRAVYPVGSTTVNISKQQAINTAEQYISNYTSKFNLTINQTSAQLISYLRNQSALYPAWSVMLYFGGNVSAVNEILWADSGEVFWCYQEGSPLDWNTLKTSAYPEPIPPDATATLPQPQNITSNSDVNGPTAAPTDTSKAAGNSASQWGIWVTILVVVAAVVAYVLVMVKIATFRGKKRLNPQAA